LGLLLTWNQEATAHTTTKTIHNKGLKRYDNDKLSPPRWYPHRLGPRSFERIQRLQLGSFVRLVIPSEVGWLFCATWGLSGNNV
jgi:hypothetical protein